MRLVCLAALLLAATAAAPQPPSPPAAQTPAGSGPAFSGLALSGRIMHPRTLLAADLAALPAVTVEVPSSGKPGAMPVQFAGALLWPLLNDAGWVDLPGRKTRLQHVVLARGSDGYAVALAIAEIDPAFEGKQVIIATSEAGKRLAAPELVVPGDRRAGRHVHGLVALEVQ